METIKLENKDRLGVWMRKAASGAEWVARVRCAAGHGGNRQLSGPIPGGAYQCAGCGAMYDASTVRNRQANPVGESLARDLYSVEAGRDVLACLATDGEALDFASFEEWADAVGYDSDSRKAEETYRACLEVALKLRQGLGEDGLRRLWQAAEDY